MAQHQINRRRTLANGSLRRTPPTGLWLTAIVLIGLGLRIAWVLHVQPVPFGDTYWYANVAQNLAQGNGFVTNHHNWLVQPPDVPQPTAYYPPAYPVALAALWKVVGFSLRSAELFNAVLGALTILPVYGLGSKIFGQRVGLFGAGLFAVFPNAIAWLPLLLSETLFTFLFVAALWALVALQARSRAARTAAALGFGLVSGLAVLTRGEGLVLLPAALIFWLARDGRTAGFHQFAFAVLASALVLTPWTVRNWIVLDSPIPVASNTGVNLRIGNSAEATGTWVLLNEPVGGVEGWRSLDRPDWEVRGDRVYTARAVRYAVTHPGRELALAKEKIQYLYRPEDDMAPALRAFGGTGVTPRALNNAFRPVMTWAWYSALLLAIASAPFWAQTAPQRLLLPIIFALWTLFHVAFFSLARFHLPLLPLVLLAAAAGLVSLHSAVYQSLQRLVTRRPWAHSTVR